MKREITTLQDEISFDLENEIIELINEEISGNQFKKLEKAFDYEYNVMLEKK